jgi:hypothetical protein
MILTIHLGRPWELSTSRCVCTAREGGGVGGIYGKMFADIS